MSRQSARQRRADAEIQRIAVGQHHNPPFVPSSRILVTDRQGTVHVAKGDVDAACRAIAGFSRAVLSLQEQAGEIEVNPLLVKPVGEGVCALDALVIPALTQA